MTTSTRPRRLISQSYVTGFSLPSDDLSGNKNPFFTDMGIMEIREDNAEALEALHFPAG